MSDKSKPQKKAGQPASGRSDPVKQVSASATEPASPDDSLDFLAPPQSTDELGRLGKYRVLKILGKGGMGIVFMAEDILLHRAVALKVMLPSITRKASAVKRFKNEAVATAAIEHDHIVTIYEVGEDRGVLYLAMQHLKGMTLEDWLRQGKKASISQILRVAREIARGLAAAHSHNLIHRDIKPANLWLDSGNQGRVKILDFGLVRDHTDDTQLTQVGMILGTPAYMSPEQARAQPLDGRSDLFSMGCVLYRLCTGVIPFIGKDAMTVLLKIASEPHVPASKLNPAIPAGLSSLIDQLLAKNPADRPASAKDVAATIQALEREAVAAGRTVAVPSLGASVASAPVSSTQATPGDDYITDVSLLDVDPQPISRQRPRWWLWGSVAACALLSSCFLGFVLTDHGQVVVQFDDDEIAGLLKGSPVRVVDNAGKEHFLVAGPNTLHSNDYAVADADKHPRLAFEPARFTVTRGADYAIHVKLLAPALAKSPFGSDTAHAFQDDWAKFLKRSVVESNSAGMKLALIPPGEFWMGSDKQLLGKAFDAAKNKLFKQLPEGYAQNVVAESPLHKVRITRPFLMARTETTVGDFRKFVKETKHRTEAELPASKGGTHAEDPRQKRDPKFDWRSPGYLPSGEQPVTNVTWKDAEAFCAWLSRKEKRTYRLPTEAEWEHACRAGTATLWSFGDDFKPAREHMWSNTLNLKTTLAPHSVGKKEANAFGLFDMHGNVEEMCADFKGRRYASEPALDDPKNPTDMKQGRVARGGSYLDIPHAGRSAYRGGGDPNLPFAHLGFRVVCEIPATRPSDDAAAQ